MRTFVVGMLFLLLAGCAAGVAPVKEVDRGSLLEQLALLPGAAIENGEPLQFGYPGAALFGSAAVLPLPGGTGVLDPLADFFLRFPELSWDVEVRARTAYGEDYDQNLAEKRSELLATYLLSRGVNLQRLYFSPLAGEGEPLIFTLQQPSTLAEP